MFMCVNNVHFDTNVNTYNYNDTCRPVNTVYIQGCKYANTYTDTSILYIWIHVHIYGYMHTCDYMH